MDTRAAISMAHVTIYMCAENRSGLDGNTGPCVLVVGALPPPVNGMAAVTGLVTDELERIGQLLERINLIPAVQRGTWLYIPSRFARVVVACVRIIFARAKGGRVLYMPVDGAWGLVFNMLVALVARVCGYKMFLHHHSFAYINTHSKLMALFLRTLSKGTTHIFLCCAMAEKFTSFYQPSWRASVSNSLIVENDFMVSPAESPVAARSGTELVIGHMSNLGTEKGTDVFLDLCETLGLNGVKFLIAGPCVDKCLAARIRGLTKRPDNSVVWSGPVSGAAKMCFFSSIDLFVFPTRYIHEAQPLVLLEALSFGVPIATVRRGCIACDYEELDVGLIGADDDDLRLKLPVFIQGMVEDKARVLTLREAAIAASRSRHDAARMKLHGLLRAMGSVGTGS